MVLGQAVRKLVPIRIMLMICRLLLFLTATAGSGIAGYYLAIIRHCH